MAQTPLICPGCGGVLSERHEAGVTHWECMVGHRYSPEVLADSQAEDVEAALWAAIRSLTDRSRLLHRLADQAQLRGQVRTSQSFRERARESDEQATLVRRVLNQAAQGALRKLDEGNGRHVEDEGSAV
jgi:two-component system chemotaxis response regulator CheB